jgi:alpha-glucosidase (family GH31 glycosyl hydrolase)
MNSCQRSSTPWLHPETIAPIRAAIRLRYLMPYLIPYSSGRTPRRPILRPLFTSSSTTQNLRRQR